MNHSCKVASIFEAGFGGNVDEETQWKVAEILEDMDKDEFKFRGIKSEKTIILKIEISSGNQTLYGIKTFDTKDSSSCLMNLFFNKNQKVIIYHKGP